jgi:NAD(P)-dependent dehydrogenase (short-subunit alcohol dehydrogenase family)
VPCAVDDAHNQHIASSTPKGTSVPEQLNGRIVAITGAGRGIGAATARQLAAAGAKVAIADLDLGLAQAVAEEIGGRAYAVDVTDSAAFDAFLDQVEADLGPLDVLINNAGIMPLAELLDEDDARIRRVFELNTLAMMHGTREAARRMVPRGSGQVVNVASTAGEAGIPGATTYCASKAAVIAFSDAADVELRPKGVFVTCVMPGITRTELASGVRDLPGFHAVTPENVAAGIVAAIRKPRFAVHVPRSAGPLIRTTSLLPRRLGLWLGHAMGADTVFLDALHDPERNAYRHRVGESGDER